MFGLISTKNLYMCELQYKNETKYIIATRLSDYIYKDYYSGEIHYYSNRFLEDDGCYVVFSCPIFLTKLFVREDDLSKLLERYNEQSKRLRRTL